MEFACPFAFNICNNNNLGSKPPILDSMAYYLHAMKTKKNNDQKSNWLRG